MAATVVMSQAVLPTHRATRVPVTAVSLATWDGAYRSGPALVRPMPTAAQATKPSSPVRYAGPNLYCLWCRYLFERVSQRYLYLLQRRQLCERYGNTSCSPWLTCGQGEYRVNGSASADATCSNCPTNTYQSSSSNAGGWVLVTLA